MNLKSSSCDCRIEKEMLSLWLCVGTGEPQKSTFTRFMSSEEIHEQHGECRGSYSEGKREISEVKVSLHSIIARWGMRWMWQSLIFLLLLLFFVFISIRKSRQCFPTLSSSCGSSRESPSSRLQLETWDSDCKTTLYSIWISNCVLLYLFVPHIALYSCDGVVNSMNTKSETLARQQQNVFEDQVKRDLRALWEISQWSCIAEKENKQILEYLRLLLSFSSAELLCWLSNRCYLLC